MLVTRRGLIKRLLDPDPRARARCVRRYFLPGSLPNWRAVVGADHLTPEERRSIQRTLLDHIDDDSARPVLANLDRWNPDWRPFIVSLVRRHAGQVTGQLFEMIGDHRPARVTVAVVGLAELAPENAEAAAAIRRLIVTGEPVSDRVTVTEAVRALGRLGDDDSITLLSQLCRSPEAWRRQTAALGLASARRPQAVKALLPFADEADLITPRTAALLTAQIDIARMMPARDQHLARVSLVLYRALVAGVGEEIDLLRLPRLRLSEQTRALTGLVQTRPRLPVVEAALDVTGALANRWWPAYRAMRARRPDETAERGVPGHVTEQDRREAALGAALDDLQAILDEAGSLNRPDVVRSLIDGLDDPEEGYVRRSVLALGRLGGAGGVGALVQLLPTAWGDLRHDVIRTLGALGAEGAAESLLEALRARLDERSLSDRQFDKDEQREMTELFQALGRLDGGVPLWVMRSALEEDDLETRCVALEALGRLIERHDRDAVELVITALQAERDPTVRAAAARAMGHDVASHGAEVLVSALSDNDPEVRRAAIRSLGRMGAVTAAPAVQRFVRDPGLRREAALAVGRMSRGRIPNAVLHVLVEIASDLTHVGTAVEAIEILGRYDIYEAQIALEHLAKDNRADPAIRAAAEHARWNRQKR